MIGTVSLQAPIENYALPPGKYTVEVQPSPGKAARSIPITITASEKTVVDLDSH